MSHKELDLGWSNNYFKLREGSTFNKKAVGVGIGTTIFGSLADSNCHFGTHNLWVRVLLYSRTHNLWVRVLSYSRTHNLRVRVLPVRIHPCWGKDLSTYATHPSVILARLNG
jgi:hypothetical protein